MHETPIQKTRNKLAMIYGVGIVAFVAIVGSITAIVRFVMSVDMG